MLEVVYSPCRLRVQSQCGVAMRQDQEQIQLGLGRWARGTLGGRVGTLDMLFVDLCCQFDARTIVVIVIAFVFVFVFVFESIVSL